MKTDLAIFVQSTYSHVLTNISKIMDVQYDVFEHVHNAMKEVDSVTTVVHDDHHTTDNTDHPAQGLVMANTHLKSSGG